MGILLIYYCIYLTAANVLHLIFGSQQSINGQNNAEQVPKTGRKKIPCS